ncbi:MAG: type II toxin-antitoxin system RelE family toxin [Anaerovoracaceae bacterium]
MYKIVFKHSAEKALEKLPKIYYQNIRIHIDNLENNPRPHGCKKLVALDNTWRIRVGIYRIVYSIYDDKLIVEIIDIDHRKDVYRV